MSDRVGESLERLKECLRVCEKPKRSRTGSRKIARVSEHLRESERTGKSKSLRQSDGRQTITPFQTLSNSLSSLSDSLRHRSTSLMSTAEVAGGPVAQTDKVLVT